MTALFVEEKLLTWTWRGFHVLRCRKCFCSQRWSLIFRRRRRRLMWLSLMCSDASLLDVLENIADVMAKTTSPSIGPRVLFCSQITSYAYCLWHFMASVICGCLYSSFLRWNVKIKRDIYFMHIAQMTLLHSLSSVMPHEYYNVFVFVRDQYHKHQQ